MDLAKLVESTVFPAVSFGPISHALCRLVSADNRSVVCYGARALKLLLLDDALRPQAIVAGVPSVVCTAIKRWDDEVLCLRELLAALQTLCWDKLCIKSVLQHKEILKNVCDYINASDAEVSQLALAVLANTLSFADSLLLTDTVAIETLGTALPHVLKVVSSSKDRPMRFYAAAAVANASCNPRLAELITAQDGLAIVRDLEKQSVAQMHVLGSRMADCAQAALYRISLHKEGDRQFATSKFRSHYVILIQYSCSNC